MIVSKKDGTWRFAIDFRQLNFITIRDMKPMPRIEDLISFVSDATHFVLLDLRSGFWQIPLRPDQRHLTAFSTHHAHWHFKRMPFGIVNGPASFQRWIESMVGDLFHNGVSAYIDDVLIYATSEEQLIDRLDLTLQWLAEGGAKLKMTKCEIAPRKFEYLGHQFEGGVRSPQTRKLLKYRQVKTPQTVRDIKSILGMLSYYRIYIPNYAQLIHPLTLLLRKSNPFQWTQAHQDALTQALEILDNAHLQQAPLHDIFRLETHASDSAVGGVLYDKICFDSSPDHCLPITFFSKTLSELETTWPLHERLIYSIVWGLEAVQSLVKGREVHVYCNLKNFPTLMNTGKTLKSNNWRARLTEYRPQVHYIPDRDNVVATFLSDHLEDPGPPKMFYCAPLKRREPPDPDTSQEVRRRKRRE